MPVATMSQARCNSNLIRLPSTMGKKRDGKTSLIKTRFITVHNNKKIRFCLPQELQIEVYKPPIPDPPFSLEGALEEIMTNSPAEPSVLPCRCWRLPRIYPRRGPDGRIRTAYSDDEVFPLRDPRRCWLEPSAHSRIRCNFPNTW